MSDVKLQAVKEIQKEIRKLYWKAVEAKTICDVHSIAAHLEALDLTIEREVFDYEGD